MDQQASVRRHDAVMFDLDGTLIDSAPDIRAAINRVMAEDRLPPLDLALVTSFIGNGVARLVARAYRHQGTALDGQDFQATVARFSEVYQQNAAVLTKPFPGVVAGLEALKGEGVRLGVCTNKPAGIARRILEALDLGRFFAAVIGGDSCAKKKPAPDPLLACLNALEATAARAVYVGDSETDLQTARAAGVPVILVTYGYTATPVEHLGADGLIARISDLPWIDYGSLRK